MRNTMSIILTGDNHYLEHAKTFISNCSYFHQEEQVQYFLVSPYMSEDNLAEIQQVAKYFGHHATWLTQSDDDFAFLAQANITSSRWGYGTFYWMLAGQYLPEDVTRALAIDLDVVVVGNMRALFESEFEPGRVAMSFGEDPQLGERRRGLGYTEGAQFSELERRRGVPGNAGFLLLNVEEMRRQGINKEFLAAGMPKLLELGTYQNGGEQVHAMGDQGYAWWLMPEKMQINPTPYVFHNIWWWMTDRLSDDIVAVHFAGSGSQFFETYLETIAQNRHLRLWKTYWQAKLTSLQILGKFDEVWALSQKILDENKRLKTVRHDFVGVIPDAAPRRYWGTWMKSQKIPNQYIIKNDRKDIGLYFRTINPVDTDKLYELTATFTFNFESDKPVRIIAETPLSEGTQEVARVMPKYNQPVTITKRVRFNRDYEALSINSNDMSGPYSKVQVSELKLVEVADDRLVTEKYVVAFRTHTWDAVAQSNFEQLQKSVDTSRWDVVILADETNGELATPTGIQKISHTADLSRFGLPDIPTSRSLWRNGDYALQPLKEAIKAPAYIILENDVLVQGDTLFHHITEHFDAGGGHVTAKYWPKGRFHQVPLHQSASGLYQEGTRYGIAYVWLWGATYDEADRLLQARLELLKRSDGTDRQWPIDELFLGTFYRMNGITPYVINDDPEVDTSQLEYRPPVSILDPDIYTGSRLVHPVVAQETIFTKYLDEESFFTYGEMLSNAYFNNVDPGSRLRKVMMLQKEIGDTRDLYNRMIRQILQAPNFDSPSKFATFASENGFTYPDQIDGQNLALFKPLQLSSTFANNNWRAFTYGGAATDGNLDLDKYRMGGFGTKKEANPWAILDLEHVYALNGVKLYHRDGYFERTKHIIVEASTDGEHYEVVADLDQLVFEKQVSTRNKQGYVYLKDVALKTIEARYLKFTLVTDNSEFFHLNQIEVFGHQLSGDELIKTNREAITNRTVGLRKQYFQDMLNDPTISESDRDQVIFETFAYLRKHKAWANIESHARYIEEHVAFSSERSIVKFESVKWDFNRNRKYTQLPVDVSKLNKLFPYEDGKILLDNRIHVWKVTSTQFTDSELDMLLWFQTNWDAIVIRSTEITQENEGVVALNQNFVFWRQGMANAPELIQLIYKHNQKVLDNQIVLIDDNQLEKYVDLSNVDFLERLTQPQYADYLRVKLLARYGGFWLDATVLVNEGGKYLFAGNTVPHFVTGRPVSQDIQNVSDATVSAYGAEQGNEINRLMQATIELYMAEHQKFPEYFFINRIYNYIIARRSDLKKMVQESDYYLVEGYDGAAQQIFEPEKHLLPQEQEKYEQLMNEPILKLTYKGLHRNKSNSVLSAIINQLRDEVAEDEYLFIEDATGSLEDFVANHHRNYELLRGAISSGKTIDGYDSERGYILKPIESIDLGLSKFNKIHYKLEEPIDSEEYLPNKLIVRFSPHEAQNSVIAKERYFGTSEFESLSKSIAKNTYILRIADVNLVSGSYYLPTRNFLDYDNQILILIEMISNQYGISSDHIVMLGTSRGGTAALYYAAKGGFSAVAGDPIVSYEYTYTANHDGHLLFDYLPQELYSIINAADDKVGGKRYIYSNDQLFSYRDLPKLTLTNTTISNLREWQKTVGHRGHAHGVFVNKTIPYQLSLLNSLLYGFDADLFELPSPFVGEVEKRFDIVKPIPSKYVTVQSSTDKIICTYDVSVGEGGNFWFPLGLKKTLSRGSAYHLEVEVNLSEIRFFFHHFSGKIQRLNPISVEQLPNGNFLQTYEFMARENFSSVFFSRFSLDFGKTLEISRFKIRIKGN
jgi:lipopolysaccharide biosynthesis glycosyltransferase